MSQKIVITGGHLTPALAFIEEIVRDKGNWEIHYLGRKYALSAKQRSLSFEYLYLKNKKNIVFHPLIRGKLQRTFQLKSLIGLLKIPIGFFQSLYYLLKVRPKVIVSFGGFLSVPVVFSGYILGIPSYTHEQTSTLGLANKINSLFVKKVAVSFPWVKRLVPNKKAITTGNLIGSTFYNPEPAKDSNLYKFVKKSKKPILFVTGGKTGSKTINQVVVKTLPQLTREFNVVHQIGLDKSSTEKQTENYFATRFIPYEHMGWMVQNADLIICRSGANTVLELASLKVPAILIPIPWVSKNEQYKNAKFLEKIGLGKIITQKNLNEKELLKTIKEFNYKNVKVNYPSWWKEIDPKKAAKRFWSIISLDNDL